MEYHQITINEYYDSKMRLKEALNDIKDGCIKVHNGFIKAGYELKNIQEKKLYELGGYKTLTEFAQAEYKLGPSAVSRIIGINDRFSVNGNTPILIGDFENFGISKLSEMLTLSDDDIKLIKENTTVATIREIKQFNKQEPEEIKDESEDAESRVNTQPEDDLHKVIIEFFRNEKELLDDVWQQSTEEDIAEIINPTGNRTYKKGLYMLLFYDHKDGLALKKFGQSEAKIYTWYDFMSAIVDIYKEYYEDGQSVHERYYGKAIKTENEAEELKNGTNELKNGTNETKTPKNETKIHKNGTEDVTVSEVTGPEIVPEANEELEEKVTEAAEDEEKKEEILTEEEIATSQVNTQLEEQSAAIENGEKVLAELNLMKIHKTNGKIVYEKNGVIMDEVDEVYEIRRKIVDEITKEVACNNKICTITFRKE